MICFQLFSAYDVMVYPENKASIKTDLLMQMPLNTYGRIAARSGLALNKFLGIGGM